MSTPTPQEDISSPKTAAVQLPGVYLLPKLMYFLLYGAGAALIPFLAVYYRSVGLNESAIGVLAALPPLLTMFSGPLWGGFADVTQQHKRLLAVAVLGTMVFVLGMTFAGSFFLLLLLVSGYAFFMAPVIPFLDNTVLNLLGKNRDQYGKQRFWGAVGWGISAPVVGWLAQQYGLRWPFYAYLVLMAGMLLVSMQLPFSQQPVQSAFWRGVRSLAASRQWQVFLALIFLGGMNMAVTTNYLFLYIGDLGGSRTLMGFTLTVATLSEMPVLFFADRLLKRFGARPVLVLGLAIFSIRTAIMSLLVVAWPILILQLLHGPSFAAMWSAGVLYAGQIAPKGLGATAQGVFSAVFMGLGSAAGAFIGGALYAAAGGALMYRWMGLLMLAGIVLYFIYERSEKARA